MPHPEAPIELATALASDTVDDGGELAVVLGYWWADDVSARDWQKRPELGGGQWCRGKTFDCTSCMNYPVAELIP